MAEASRYSGVRGTITPVVKIRSKAAFSLLELLVCIAIIALLLGILLPVLVHARRVGYAAVCSSNLRQLSIGWQSYLQDNKDMFPRYGALPEWEYGGAVFVGAERRAALDARRPINRHLDATSHEDSDLARLFHCPGDQGVYERGVASRGRAGPSLLARGSAFEQYGTSYRANPLLMDSSKAGLDRAARPLGLHELHTDHSRVLLTADATWAYATATPGSDEASREASWHGNRDQGNMLAVDGSVRFINFAQSPRVEFVISPRPEIADAH